MNPQPLFGSSALADLRARTEYEAWLLEAVYEIADRRIAVEDADQLIYPPSGVPPTQVISGVGNFRTGDWRPGFLKVAAPLVLVTTFKLLDMLLEWILVENGHKSTFRFAQKIQALKSGVKLPALIETRPWLKERLTALYERLEPLRGTIIHASHFTSTDGNLQVSSSKDGTPGPGVDISAEDLRTLAVLLVSLLRYLEGTWVMDTFREKRIRRTLDDLAHLHKLASFGQLSPAFLTVRVYVTEGESIRCDLDRIRRDVAASRAGQDTMFDLRVVAVAADGSRAATYLVPWDQLQGAGSILEQSISNLGPAQNPPGLDLNSLAQALAMRGPLAP